MSDATALPSEDTPNPYDKGTPEWTLFDGIRANMREARNCQERSDDLRKRAAEDQADADHFASRAANHWAALMKIRSEGDTNG